MYTRFIHVANGTKYHSHSVNNESVISDTIHCSKSKIQYVFTIFFDAIRESVRKKELKHYIFHFQAPIFCTVENAFPLIKHFKL